MGDHRSHQACCIPPDSNFFVSHAIPSDLLASDLIRLSASKDTCASHRCPAAAMVTCDDDFLLLSALKHTCHLSVAIQGLIFFATLGLVRSKTIPGCLEIQTPWNRFTPSPAKSKCCSSIWQRKSISVTEKGALSTKIKFIGSQLHRNEARINSDYRMWIS